MRAFPITLLSIGLALAPAVSAQDRDLPSAPSAVLEEQNKPKAQPPAQAPAQPINPQGQAKTEGTPSQDPAGAQPTAKPVESSSAPGSVRPAPAPTAAVNTGNGGNSSSDLPEAEYTYRSRVDEVNVIFTVTDKHGKFIKDLNQGDFEVLDDNKAPKQVVGFSRQTNLPLRVGLLIDSSNSIRDRFKFEQEAAIEFLNQIVRPKSDRAFVIGFDTTAEITADYTDDAERLSRGVRMLRPGGGTALYDAVYFACRDKLMKAQQSGPVRRAIVLLSDGDDNQSRVTREEAIEMAQRAEVIIYAISTNSSGYKERGDKVLERMSDATGGRAFFPFKVEDVANAFSEIQDELRSQYAIAYRPALFTPDGRYHSIEILAQNHKSLKVRSRKGYFAPKQ